MMKICFTLDDVIRAKTIKIGETYKKYINPDINLDGLDLSTNDYCKIFGFKNEDEYEKFLYEDYAFDIFAHANVTKKSIDKEMILWHLNLQDYDCGDEKIELMIANPFEFNTSIGFTCFFLSKIATRIREFYFPADSLSIWDKCDVLVTADPRLINAKPEGKKCIKIEMPYNKDCEADITYSNLSEAFNNNDMLDKLFDKK